MKLLKSTGLIIGPMGLLTVLGLPSFFLIWAIVLGLFLVSRISKSSPVFSGWSWPEFLVTIGLGLGIPYLILFLSAGF